MSIEVQQPNSLPPTLIGYVFFSNFPVASNLGTLVTHTNLTKAISIILDIPEMAVWVVPFNSPDLPDVRWTSYVRSEFRASVERYHRYFNEELKAVMEEVENPSQALEDFESEGGKVS